MVRALPGRQPDLDRRWVIRVPPDPYVRFDTNDYSLDPNLVGRRVEVRVSQREIIATALDSGELACRHERCFANHRTIEHARALRARELVHLFRELKAPAAARGFGKLADRARDEQWSYERSMQALLSTEVSSRESSGGRLRIRAARFPAHKTLEDWCSSPPVWPSDRACH